MSKSSNIFIGFASSDKFIDAIDHKRPVNLSVHRKFGKPMKYGISIDNTILIMSQVVDGEVLYFQMTCHRYQTMQGQPLMSDRDPSKVSRISDQVKSFAERYLDDHGLSWREACVSMPANYITLDGEATFLKWDKPADGYLYVDGDGKAELNPSEIEHENVRTLEGNNCDDHAS